MLMCIHGIKLSTATDATKGKTKSPLQNLVHKIITAIKGMERSDCTEHKSILILVEMHTGTHICNYVQICTIHLYSILYIYIMACAFVNQFPWFVKI